MKKSKLLFSLASVLIIASMVLGACAPKTEKPASEGLAVGIVLPTKDEPRWIQDETRFKDAAAVPASLEYRISSERGELLTLPDRAESNPHSRFIGAQNLLQQRFQCPLHFILLLAGKFNLFDINRSVQSR